MRFSAAAVLTILIAVASGAQTHPDFSGTWTIDTAKSDARPATAPNQIAIRQTPADITITRGAQNLTYQFDGTETFAFQQGETRGTVAWDGDKVVISWKKEVGVTLQESL